MSKEQSYDCIIIGGGPGGLQGSIHLARCNRKVLLIDQGGGQTKLANDMVNYLGIPAIDGLELTRIGFLQARSFGVTVKSKTAVTGVSREKDGSFTVETAAGSFSSPFLIAASGAKNILPQLKNLRRFLGKGFYTSVASDGHRTRDKELLVMGDNLNTVRLALAMKKMYTERVVLLLEDIALPEEYLDTLIENLITVVRGTPVELLGQKQLIGLLLADGRLLDCQTIMANYGSQLNDHYLKGLPLKRDRNNFRFLADPTGETSIPGLFVTGGLRTDDDLTIIAAGHGATAAVEINARLLER
jgi:thioredoxin reductase (NADPH)